MARRATAAAAESKIAESLSKFFTDHKKGEPIDVRRATEELKKIGRLYLLKMNKVQQRFIRTKNNEGRTPKRRILEAGNKLGKCLTYQTLIDTPNGKITMGELYKAGKPFLCYAWDGSKKVIAQASSPFKKPGTHQCYRIEMEDGQWVEGADYHRILCGDASYHTLDQLVSVFLACSLHTSVSSQPQQEVSLSPLESTGDTYFSVLPSGVVHLSEKQSDFLRHYSQGFRRYDGPPLRGVGNVQVSVPSHNDVQLHSVHSSRMDDSQHIRTNTPSISSVHLSILGALLRSVALSFGSAIEAFGTLFQSFPNGPRLSPQPCFAEGVRPQPNDEFFQGLPWSDSAVSSSKSSLECGNKIVSFYPITCQEVYDFEVEKYHNYFAGGLIHHNSTIGFAEDIAHAMGFRPWLPKDDPDYKINIKIPNQGLIGCETMLESVPGVVEPNLRALIPAHCMAEYKNNQQGVLKTVTIPYDYLGNACGSVIHIRSYNQEATTFEGIDYSWEHWDEPPPEDVFKAAERGKVATNAPSWYTMTPLKEPYIYDKFSLKAFNNGGDDQEIAVFRGAIWDNCQDWCRKCDVEVPENRPENMESWMVERPVNRCPTCNEIMGFIPKKGIEEYLKTLDPDERRAREEGEWAHLSGLVYKEMSRETHIYKDFTIPSTWMRIEAVDPHDARPTRWLFGAVSPEEIQVAGKTVNRVYFYTYLLANGNIDEIARKVKVKRAEHNYSNPSMVILDAKYGRRSIKTGDKETSWEDELIKAGIKKIVLSHSSAGDVALGHKVVKEYLKPHYSTVKDKDIPGMLFAEEGCKGDRGPIQDMFNYQWKPGTDKPEEAYKDMADCVRYVALEKPNYKEPERDDMESIIKNLLSKKENTYDPLRFGLGVN